MKSPREIAAERACMAHPCPADAATSFAFTLRLYPQGRSPLIVEAEVLLCAEHAALARNAPPLREDY